MARFPGHKMLVPCCSGLVQLLRPMETPRAVHTVRGWPVSTREQPSVDPGPRQSRHVSPRVASGNSGVRACCRRQAAIFV
jgi:hypothetical protein